MSDENKTKLSLDDLKELITEQVGEAVDSRLEKAKEEQSEWFNKLKADFTKTQEQSELPKGVGIGRFFQVAAQAQNDPERAKRFIKARWGEEDPLYQVLTDAFSYEAQEKAQAAGDLSAGGFVVPPAFVQDVIEFLRSRSIVRTAGGRVIPMPNGSITIPKQTQGSSASYIGENEDVPETSVEGGHVRLTAKKLAALVPISNDLLRGSGSLSVDQMIRDDVVDAMAAKEDQAFLRSKGSEYEPRGLRYLLNNNNVLSTAGTTTDNIVSDITDMLNQLLTADIPMNNPVWMMNPKQRTKLQHLRDSGALVFEETRQNTLLGYPIFVSNHVPANLGGSNDESELYLVDMNQFLIGEQGTIEVAASTEATYVSGGNPVSAFSRDQSVLRAISRHDVALRHDTAAVVTNDVTWGNG